MVIEDSPPPVEGMVTRSWQLLLLSARSEAALETMTDNLAAHLAAHPDLDLADVAYTLSVGRTRSELTNLFGRQPRSVWVYKDGIEIEVPFASVQAGDLVIVDAGHMIPVDGVIAEGMASIDQHALTGESQPAEKTVGNPVYAATIAKPTRLHGQFFMPRRNRD